MHKHKYKYSYSTSQAFCGQMQTQILVGIYKYLYKNKYKYLYPTSQAFCGPAHPVFQSDHSPLGLGHLTWIYDNYPQKIFQNIGFLPTRTISHFFHSDLMIFPDISNNNKIWILIWICSLSKCHLTFHLVSCVESVLELGE